MKLVSFKAGDGLTHAGALHEKYVAGLEYPALLELLRDPVGLEHARAARTDYLTKSSGWLAEGGRRQIAVIPG